MKNAKDKNDKHKSLYASKLTQKRLNSQTAFKTGELIEAFPHFQMLLCKPALQKQETYLCAQCSQHTSQWTKVWAYQVWPSSEEAPQNSCFPNFYELVDTMAL